MTEQKSTSAGAQSAGGAPPAGGGGDEFAHIPTPRTRHPILAIAAAALALFLVVHVRQELRYALSSGQPLDLGDARVTFAPRVTPSGFDNRYVRVRGTPDRESGLEVDTKGAWTFTQFFRVMGTGERLFVHRLASPLPAALAEEDVFEGRLVRFGELPFEDAVRRYFSAHVVASHFFAAEDVRAALVAAHGGPLSLRDRAGDPVTVATDDQLVIDVRRADEVRIGLPRERFADDAAARAEIEKRGGTIVSSKGLMKVDVAPAAPGGGFVGGGPPPTERWTYVARFPADGRQAALSALGDLDRKVEIRDARETLRVRVTDMAAAEGALSLRPGGGSERVVPFADIAAVRTLSTVHVPDDAFLLIEGDRPRDHLPTLFLALAVAMFGAFNLAALARELRR
jgi:hypothetical protein